MNPLVAGLTDSERALDGTVSGAGYSSTSSIDSDLHPAQVRQSRFLSSAIVVSNHCTETKDRTTKCCSKIFPSVLSHTDTNTEGKPRLDDANGSFCLLSLSGPFSLARMSIRPVFKTWPSTYIYCPSGQRIQLALHGHCGKLLHALFFAFRCTRRRFTPLHRRPPPRQQSCPYIPPRGSHALPGPRCLQGPRRPITWRHLPGTCPPAIPCHSRRPRLKHSRATSPPLRPSQKNLHSRVAGPQRHPWRPLLLSTLDI